MCEERLKEKLIELEKRLHSLPTRKSKQELTQILHPQFKEIGYSGRVFNLQQIIADLANELPPTYKVISTHYELTRLADDICVVSYLSARQQADGSLSRHARRTSLWKIYKSEWTLIFHQATPVEADSWGR